MPEQNYQNHARVVPLYHYGVFLTLLAYFVWGAWQLVQGVSLASAMTFILSIALIFMAFSLRSQVLTVQDRVIRLEMRLRMRDVLPADLAARGSELPIKQLVALRFASDTELAHLVTEVLEGRLKEIKEIKARVKDWQGDFLRA